MWYRIACQALSTLLRSIHSVLNRSPPQLLKEIILIDDGSDKAHLKEPLEAYIARLPKVRLIRQEERKGTWVTVFPRSAHSTVRNSDPKYILWRVPHPHCSKPHFVVPLERNDENNMIRRAILAPMFDRSTCILHVKTCEDAVEI